MYSYDGLKDIMELELFLGKRHCDSYGTVGMSAREREEPFPREPPSRENDAILLCYVRYDPKTGTFTEIPK